MKRVKHPLVEDTATVDDVDLGTAQMLYNHAFAEAVIDHLPDAACWQVEIDQYGGYELVRENDDERAFGSDGVGCFAYYLDKASIRDRCTNIPS